MKKLSHQFDKPKRSVASPEALEALRNNNAVRWYVLSLPDCHRGGVRGLQRDRVVPVGLVTTKEKLYFVESIRKKRKEKE